MGLRLFVGNLSFETTDEDLMQAFSKAGACSTAAVIKDRLTGRSRGFGFVEMASDEEAQKAIAELNGRELRGRSINVSEARERSEGRAPRAPSGPRRFSNVGPPGDAPRFRKDGGSRRGLRARKRSL